MNTQSAIPTNPSAQQPGIIDQLFQARQVFSAGHMELKNTIESMEALRKILEERLQEINTCMATIHLHTHIQGIGGIERQKPNRRETSPDNRLAFSMKETADSLGASYTTIWRLVKRGLLRPSRAFGRARFSKTEIERFLRETT